MKRIYLFSALLFLPLFSIGQTDPIEDEIMNYSASKSDIISKARRLLLDSFMADDLDKVEQVKNYLLYEVEDEHYGTLYPAEHWLLLYWTEEFEVLLETLQDFDESSYVSQQQKIWPAQDLMFAHLQGKSVAWKEKLEWKIRNSAVSEEEKDLLRLNLEWLLAEESEPDYLSNLNQRADEYLEAYPDSAYEDFVRQELRYKYVPSKWGLGFELFSGYGIFTGELADSFTNPVAFGVGFDGEYDKLTLYVRMAGWIGKTAQELSDGQGIVWEKGKAAHTFLGEASFGYAVLDSEKLKFSPFVGIGVAEIMAPEDDLNEDPDLEQLAVGSDVTYQFGANLDFKLGWNTGELVENNKTYWYLRLRYGYVMPQFLGDPQGNMHTISIGLGGVFRGLKREL